MGKKSCRRLLIHWKPSSHAVFQQFLLRPINQSSWLPPLPTTVRATGPTSGNIPWCGTRGLVVMQCSLSSSHDSFEVTPCMSSQC